MKKRLSSILCILVIPFLISGCTPYKEIKELAIVEGLAVDKNPNGSYLLTFQIFSPQSAGGGAGGNQPAATQTQNMQSSGVSLFDASRNFTKQTGKKLYYSNVQAVVMGKEICQSDFKKLLDFLERNHEIAPSQRMFMAENRAEDIFTAKSEQGNISAADISLISQNGYNTSMIIDQTLNDIERDESSGSTDIVLPVLSIQKEPGKSSSSGSSSSSGGGGGSSSGSSSGGSDIVVINSTAVLSNNKFAGTLDSDETRGVMWVSEKVQVKSGVINLNPDGNGVVSMEILGNTTKTTVSTQGGMPCMDVDIGFTTRLAESEAENLKVNADFFQKIMTLQNNEVKLEAEQALNTALIKYKADIFSFGEKIYETQPQMWHNISSNWRGSLSTLTVNLTVHSAIDDAGIISQ